MRTASCDNFRSAFALKKDTYEPCEIHNRLGCLGGINVFLAICKLAHSWYSVTFVDALTREQSEAPVSNAIGFDSNLVWSSYRHILILLPYHDDLVVS